MASKKNNFSDKFDDVIEQALQTMQNEFKDGKRSKNTVTELSFLGTKGTYHKINNNICHAGLNHPGAEPKTILHSIQELKCDKEIAHSYLDWLFHISPYKEVFLSQDEKRTMADGIIVARTNVPANLMAGGLIAARMLSEFASIPKVWNAFTKQGLHPDISFIYAHCFAASGKQVISDKEENDKRFNRNMDGDKLSIHKFDSVHTAINSYGITDKYVTNFHKNIRQDTGLYNKQCYYSSINVTWAGPNPDVKDNKVSDGIDAFFTSLTQKRGKKSGANPFAGNQPAVVQSVPFDEGIAALADYFKTGYKEII